jgi:hypothetical protein
MIKLCLPEWNIFAQVVSCALHLIELVILLQVLPVLPPSVQLYCTLSTVTSSVYSISISSVSIPGACVHIFRVTSVYRGSSDMLKDMYKFNIS